jgi:hypothetical protein
VVASWEAGGAELTPVEGLVPDPDAALAATVEGLAAGLRGGRAGDAVSQLAAALVEARVVAGTLGRLARESGLPKNLAWRCVQLQGVIVDGVRDAFGEVD